MKREINSETGKEKIIKFPKPEKKDSSKKNGCWAIVLVALLALIMIVCNVDKNSNFSSTTTVDETPISLSEANNYDIEKYLDGFIIAKDGKITCYNTAHLPQWEFSGSKTKPQITANGTYALIYYTNDKQAIVTNGKKTKKITTTGNVTNGYVNSNGYSVLLLEEAGLKNKIVVYNNKGELIYFRDNPDKQIPLAALSDDNKTLVTIELLFDKKHVSSELVTTNVRKNECISRTKFDDAIPGKCVFSEKNRFIMIFDTKMQCYNLRGKLKWETDFENRQADKVSYNDGMFAFVFANSDANSQGNSVVFYNKKGKRVGEFFTSEKILSIDVCDYTALITSGRKLMLVNSKGKNVSTADISYDIKETLFMNNKKAALTLSGSQQVKLVELN